MKTLEQVRDEIAGMMPGEWIVSPDGIWSKREWGDNHVRSIRAGCLPRHDHPCPTTLDGIAAMESNDYNLTVHRWPAIWTAHATPWNGPMETIRASGLTELEARTRLLHIVLTATKGATHEK